MVVLQSRNVAVLLLALCSCLVFLHAEAEDIHPEIYCHSCVLVAEEFKKVMQEPSTRRRRLAIDDLVNNAEVCNRLEGNRTFPKGQLKAACEALFDSHNDDFYAAFMSGERDRMDALLCHEKSTACVGLREPLEDKGEVPLRNVAWKPKPKRSKPSGKAKNEKKKGELEKDEL